MSNVFNKLRDFVGLNEPEEEFDEEFDEEDMDEPPYQRQETTPPPENERPPRRRAKERTSFTDTHQQTTTPSSKGNVIDMPGANNGLNEIVVIEPHAFEKMPEVIQALRERKTVLLNLNMMEPEDAQRAVDFVAGGTYAIDGNQERVGESIFLFTPSCVNVTSRSLSHQSTSSSQSANPGNVHHMNTPTPHWRNQSDQIAQ